MIQEFVTSRTRSKLLTLFLTNPKTKFYMRELEKKTGEYINSIRKELNKLEKTGLIKSENVANLKYYIINEKFLIYKELRNIILKTNPSSVLIKQTLGSLKKRFKGSLSSVILFGSLAKNNLKFNDIDLLVIVKYLPEDWRERDKTILAIEKIGLNAGITIHIELLTDKEFEFSVEQGAPLLFEISTANKIIYDNGLFKKQIRIFKENMERWKAKKINDAWKIPKLTV